MPDRPSTASTTLADAMTEADCGIQDTNLLQMSICGRKCSHLSWA